MNHARKAIQQERCTRHMTVCFMSATCSCMRMACAGDEEARTLLADIGPLSWHGALSKSRLRACCSPPPPAACHCLETPANPTDCRPPVSSTKAGTN